MDVTIDELNGEVQREAARPSRSPRGERTASPAERERIDELERSRLERLAARRRAF